MVQQLITSMENYKGVDRCTHAQEHILPEVISGFVLEFRA